MQIVLRTEECGDFVRYLPVQSLDGDTRFDAEKRFAEYVQKGTVVEGGFSDTSWRLTNQLHWVTLDFSMNEVTYKKNAEHWTGCSAECYRESMRVFAIFQLGAYSIQYLRDTIKSLRELAGMDWEEAMVFAPNERQQIAIFLKLIPESNDLRDRVIEVMEAKKWDTKGKKSRNLTNFSDYLRFNKELENFWDTASDDEKKLYFPVYFWWKLTAILPLRCTEFLLIPRDCVKEEDGRFILSIRRTRMKKGRRQVAHMVSEDYYIESFEIPSWMFKEIRRYQCLTEMDSLPDLGTLFVPRRKVPSGYYSYIQMSHLLQDFCRETMNDADYPVHLGDTRHLAMINLMLSGGSPVICRELAGHESVDISSNYYANLSTVVESMVYEYYHGWGNSSMLQGSLLFPTVMPNQKIRVDQGWCAAIEVAQGDISKCLASYSVNGHIGDCIDCRCFYPDSPGLRAQIEKKHKKTVDEDGKFLVQMIEIVRKGIGHEEDIKSALLRLQGSSCRYGAVLSEKFKEGVRDGETQKK